MSKHRYTRIFSAFGRNQIHRARCTCGQWSGQSRNPNFVFDDFLTHRAKAEHPSAPFRVDPVSGLSPERIDEVRYDAMSGIGAA